MASSDYTTLRKLKHIQNTMEIDENENETPSKWFNVNSPPTCDSCKPGEPHDINISIDVPKQTLVLSCVQPKNPLIGEMYFDDSYIYIWTGTWKKTPIS